MDEYTVGEAARLAHVTVRTLHHYDTVGLLQPSGRSPAGYRLYSAADLTRLHQILSYRALGFGLDEIAEILADPATSVDDHLRRQHRLLRERVAHNQALLAAVEKHMEARNMGIALTPEQQFEIFGRTDYAEQTAKAAELYGEFEWWQESQRRSATRTYEEWVEIKAKNTAILDKIVAAFQAGEPPNGEVAIALAEAVRQELDQWHFPCDHQTHRTLSELVTAETRAAQDEKFGSGFTQYTQDSVAANAERAAQS